jgi:2-keto-4-pentenoate hydratase/2-oxohepta-3-ene-1,7-dioic acid hydratase in catechol pathway
MKIVCVGRNYRLHAQELGNEVPQEPIFFIKPDSAVFRPGEHFYYPDFSREIHYECEVFFRICKDAKFVSEAFAPSYVDGYGLGVDFTARDVQNRLKEKGLPWEIAKAFHQSAFVSDVLPLTSFTRAGQIAFSFKKNGITVQSGSTADMIFDLKTLIVQATKYFVLRAGDLLFTGTPSGVGPVERGDRLEGFIGDQKLVDFYVR